MSGKKGPGRDVVYIRKVVEGEHGGAHGGSWKVAYADFVTALMALFLLLWLLMALKPQQKDQIAKFFESPETMAGQEHSEGKPLIGAPTTAKDLAKSLEKPKQVQLALAGKLKEIVRRDQEISSQVGFRFDSQGVLMEIPGDLLFEPASASLTPKARALLDGIASLLAMSRFDVRFVGHTDGREPIGHYPSAWEFTAARAAATLRYITSRIKVPPVRLTATGCADSRPAVPDPTPETRVKNRRIEIYYSLPNAQVRH